MSPLFTKMLWIPWIWIHLIHPSFLHSTLYQVSAIGPIPRKGSFREKLIKTENFASSLWPFPHEAQKPQTHSKAAYSFIADAKRISNTTSDITTATTAVVKRRYEVWRRCHVTYLRSTSFEKPLQVFLLHPFSPIKIGNLIASITVSHLIVKR